MFPAPPFLPLGVMEFDFLHSADKFDYFTLFLADFRKAFVVQFAPLFKE